MPGTKQNIVVAAAVSALLLTLPKDEGVRYTPYYDIAGVLTVCYGHTGSDIVRGKKYTEGECKAFLEKDLKQHMARISSCTTRELSAPQLVAFTSFDYNTGAWCSSRSNKEFSKGNTFEACRALAFSPSGRPVWSYIKNGTVFVQGLHNRRIREMNYCLRDSV